MDVRIWQAMTSFSLEYSNGDVKKPRISRREYQRQWKIKNREHVKKVSREYHIRNRDRVREISRTLKLKKLFGLSRDEYDKLLQKQKGVCAICQKPESDMRNGRIKNFSVDHCHRAGHVRALLCRACNTGLGSFHHSPKLIRKALDYIETETLFNPV